MTLAQERDVWTEYQHATGEERARLEEELVHEHQNLAHFVARKYYSSQHEPDDILQTAFIGLLKAVRGFKPESGTQFSTYAVMLMKRNVGRLFRSQYAKKREGAMDDISIYLPLNNDGERVITIADMIADDSEGPEDVVETRTMTKTITKKAEELLEGKELEVFRLKYSTDIPMTLAEIGGKMNVSGPYVRRLSESAEMKMRAYFKDGTIPEKKQSKAISWQPAELECISNMLIQGKRRKEILKHFPNRTEASVDNKIRSIRKQMRKEGQA